MSVTQSKMDLLLKENEKQGEGLRREQAVKSQEGLYKFLLQTAELQTSFQAKDQEEDARCGFCLPQKLTVGWILCN